jgi:hypothetical protein
VVQEHHGQGSRSISTSNTTKNKEAEDAEVFAMINDIAKQNPGIIPDTLHIRKGSPRSFGL